VAGVDLLAIIWAGEGHGILGAGMSASGNVLAGLIVALLGQARGDISRYSQKACTDGPRC
jgi:hypothetical protein